MQTLVRHGFRAHGGAALVGVLGLALGFVVALPDQAGATDDEGSSYASCWYAGVEYSNGSAIVADDGKRYVCQNGTWTAGLVVDDGGFDPHFGEPVADPAGEVEAVDPSAPGSITVSGSSPEAAADGGGLAAPNVLAP